MLMFMKVNYFPETLSVDIRSFLDSVNDSIYLIIWSYVGKVDVGVYSQADSQPSSLPANP